MSLNPDQQEVIEAVVRENEECGLDAPDRPA